MINKYLVFECVDYILDICDQDGHLVDKNKIEPSVIDLIKKFYDDHFREHCDQEMMREQHIEDCTGWLYEEFGEEGLGAEFVEQIEKLALDFCEKE